jgi:hypothetical protein
MTAPRTRAAAALLTLLAALPAAAGAAAPRDLPLDARQEQEATAQLPAAATSWSGLHAHHGRFAALDEGELADDYTDAVTGLLAQRWDLFPELLALSRRDPAFAGWVVRHVDASASMADLAAIIDNAEGCREAGWDLCDRVGEAAGDALEDLLRSSAQALR